MVTLTQLKYVIAVDKEKHFGRAAKECGVSQPSLSTQIQKVEDQLNIIVFDRSKKPVLTTREGQVFVKKAKEILSMVSELEHQSMHSDKVEGEFNLGVIPTLSPYLIPLFVENFSKNHPRVDLKIFELTTDEIIKKLYDDELDAGLLATPLKDDKIIERSLFSELFYFYPSKNHKYKNKKEIGLKDLESLDDFWVLSEGNCFREQIFNMCKFKNQQGKHNGIQFESGSLETIKNLIKKGSGVSVLPELALDDIKNEVIPFETPSPSREIGLVYTRSFLKEKIIDALEAEILDSLPPQIKNLKVSHQNIEFR